jgi:hypothetical protein
VKVASDLLGVHNTDVECPHPDDWTFELLESDKERDQVFLFIIFNLNTL